MFEIDYQAVAARLREARDLKGLSQTKVQELLYWGDGNSKISRIEYAKKGSGITNLETLQQLARLYGYSVQYFLFGKMDNETRKFTNNELDVRFCNLFWKGCTPQRVDNVLEFLGYGDDYRNEMGFPTNKKQVRFYNAKEYEPGLPYFDIDSGLNDYSGYTVTEYEMPDGYIMTFTGPFVDSDGNCIDEYGESCPANLCERLSVVVFNSADVPIATLYGFLPKVCGLFIKNGSWVKYWLDCDNTESAALFESAKETFFEAIKKQNPTFKDKDELLNVLYDSNESIILADWSIMLVRYFCTNRLFNEDTSYALYTTIRRMLRKHCLTIGTYLSFDIINRDYDDDLVPVTDQTLQDKFLASGFNRIVVEDTTVLYEVFDGIGKGGED